MCGISGIWSTGDESENSLINSQILMLNALKHRGPDSFGYWKDEDLPFVLGHRRLSIQDLSSMGNQPMKSNSGRYLISFNGEIYNNFEIRKMHH